MARARSDRDAERLSMGPGAVLSARRAAEMLGAIGGTDQERLDLLRAAGLVRLVRDHEIVLWSEVLAWLPTQDERARPAAKAPKKPTASGALPPAYPL